MAAEAPEPSFAERARTLLAGARTGALATLALEPGGHPYVSLVPVADDAGCPLLLLSGLAEHTRNLLLDPRASLLLHAEPEPGADPLTAGRATLVGGMSRVPAGELADRARAVYLTAHPEAERYVDFADMDFWRLTVSSVRFIAGFGSMSWLGGDDWSQAEPDPMAPFAAGIRRHMNEDHAENLLDYCHAFGDLPSARSAAMTGLDRYGFEMAAETAEGPRRVRLAFEKQIADAAEARQALVLLARRAREALGRG